MVSNQEILKLLNVMVVDDNQISSTPVLDYIDFGLVLNFRPSEKQLAALKEFYKPLDIRTLFTREERDNADPLHLISKQLLHYFEVYGLGIPGLFNLEVSEGHIITMTFIRGITRNELSDMIRKLLYTNAPMKDSVILKGIIDLYNINFDINRIANNELRVSLFNYEKHLFTSGDDAVRYICYLATGDLLLIKSRKVIKAITESIIPTNFLRRHKLPLAQVFNRHKRLIIAAKNKENKTEINNISRLSKIKHIPIKEQVSKNFISNALKQYSTYDYSVLNKISIRDKFKFLNLLSYKKKQESIDAFVIRNGKIYTKENCKIWPIHNINRVENAILDSLYTDLLKLSDKDILLDDKVDYGLPISRKQTIGKLPFGTCVSIIRGEISSGIYWENAGGATDLDLSTIDMEGKRTGWGQYSEYDRNNPITFSGDITNAPRGAMEFMTSHNIDYGLFVNIYSGDIGSEMELVIGNTTKEQWIKNPIIREKHKLNSKESIIGFIHNRNFIVYSGRLNNSRISGKKKAILMKSTCNFWTVRRLFEALYINYSLDIDTETSYDTDLRYEGFSYDKLEALLLE